MAISIDVMEKKAIGPFIKKYNMSLPSLMDPDGTVKTLYQTTGVLESFIIKKDGILIEKIMVPRNWSAPEVVYSFSDLS